MSKSLTEAARAILLKESNDATPDRDAKAQNPNRGTLHPGTKYKEDKPFANPDANSPNPEEREDLGPALTKNTDIPPSAKAASKMGKDTSRSSVAAVPAEKMKKETVSEGSVLAARAKALAEAMKKDKLEEDTETTAKKVAQAKDKKDTEAESKKNMEEEVELSEELRAFIEGLIAEGATDEEIEQAIAENFEIVSEEKKEEEEDEDKACDDEDDMKMKRKEAIKEDVNALLDGENLSEEFRAKAETIFEAAVSARVQDELKVLEEAYVESLNEEIAKIEKSMQEHIDAYLEDAANKWIAENEVAIESSLRSELTEDFISGLRTLFAEHYMDIPEEKVDIVEGFGKKIEELEKKLNEEIERNVFLNQTVNESKKESIVSGLIEDMTDTQADAFRKLAENIAFTNPEEYAQKAKILKESYYWSNNTPTGKNNQPLDPVESTGRGTLTESATGGRMDKYVAALGQRKLPI